MAAQHAAGGNLSGGPGDRRGSSPVVRRPLLLAAAPPAWWTRGARRCDTASAGYADLKNDVVFRKVFGGHPRVLIGLLNDLLDRGGDRAITEIEHLLPEQVPLAMGRKLSILDVRCREKGGATFIVEMQVLPVTAFLNRVVYNACKAYVGTLERGSPTTSSPTWWPSPSATSCSRRDAERDAALQPRVPR
ncbi:MAG: PD-(D/E)XK nuclease family transposase [Polyangiales bacterium]